MFFCYPLSSGSRGNCYLFSDGISSLLIDCGIGPRVIKRNIDDEIKRLQQNISELQRKIDLTNHIPLEPLQKQSKSIDIPQERSLLISNDSSKTYHTFQEFVQHISIDLDASTIDQIDLSNDDQHQNISAKTSYQSTRTTSKCSSHRIAKTTEKL